MHVHQPGGGDVVRRLFATCDALLFPSHMDTYGVVVGEAMSYGLPVLAPRHLALTETIQDDADGLLFPAREHALRRRHPLRVPPYPAAATVLLRGARAAGRRLRAGIADAIAARAETGPPRAARQGALKPASHRDHLSIERRRDLLSAIYDAAIA